jgi:hypothetical protein
VGRVWPRHGHRGRPLNSVVRHHKRVMRLANAIALATVFVCTAAQAEGERESPALRELLAAVQSDRDDDPPGLAKTTRLATEVGEAAVPHLARLLVSTSDASTRRRVSWALAYVGGSGSVSVLQGQATASADTSAKAPLLFAIPSTAPSEKSIGLLVNSLNGPHYGDEWFPIVQAAISLGILREKSAVAALQRAADKKQGFASSAAEMALRWIGGATFNLIAQTRSEGDDLLEAAFKYPLAEFSRFARLCETGRNRRLWRRSDSTWIIEPGCAENATNPSVVVETYRSTDGARAVMAIGFTAGSLDGAGYNIVFRRRGNAWAVVGISPTWVS